MTADESFLRFNSIKVRLRLEMFVSKLRTIPCFNSIKVRLRLKGERKTYVSLVRFQFHKGAIKTNTASLRYRWYGGFNSIKVRLRLLNLRWLERS